MSAPDDQPISAPRPAGAGHPAGAFEDLLPPLTDRLRSGCEVVLLGFGGYTAVAALAGLPGGIELLGRRLLRLAVIVGCYVALRNFPSDTVARLVALVGIAVVVGVSALNGIYQGYHGATPLVAVGISLAGAALMPWGRAFQMLVSSICFVAVVVNVAVVAAVPFEGASLQTLAVAALTLIVSNYVAGQQDRSRAMLRDRIAREREARAAERAASDEVRRLNADLEERVRTRTRELEDALRELEAFSYSVSHDLRAPARAVAGFADAIADDAPAGLDGTTRGHLDRIRRAGLRMGEMIDALLELSRLSRAQVQGRPVDLSAMAREAVADLRVDDGARVTVAPAMHVGGDPGLLRVLLDNLISNAVKFSAQRAEPRIEVGCVGDPDGETAYFVRDNGVGFDPAFAERLFHPFQRVHGDEDFEGSGIGLATVERIVRRHGGRVWAEGEVDGGATVFFTLPSPRGDAGSVAA